MVSEWIVFRLLQNIHSFCSSLFGILLGFSKTSHNTPWRYINSQPTTKPRPSHRHPQFCSSKASVMTQLLSLMHTTTDALSLLSLQNICFWNYFNLISGEARQYVQKPILIKTKTMKVKGRRTNRILKVSWPLITSQGYLHEGCTS